MKYLKVQQNLLKMADARDGWKHTPCQICWCETDDKIWVSDSHFVTGIPKSQFYLDKEKIFNNMPTEGLKKILKD